MRNKVLAGNVSWTIQREIWTRLQAKIFFPPIKTFWILNNILTNYQSVVFNGKWATAILRKMHSNIGKNQLYENLIDLHSLETLVKKEFMTNLHFQTCFQQRYKHWKCTKRFKEKNVQEDWILRSQKWPKLTQCLAFSDFKMRGGGQSPKRKTTN